VKIAFLCTGNSARSQIAEGFAKDFVKKAGKEIEVFSAGSQPAGYVHKLAIKVMEEVGIDISDQRALGDPRPGWKGALCLQVG